MRAPALVAHCAAPLAALDAQLHQLVGRLTPSQEELAAYDTALQEVSELVACRWPDAKVHLFGKSQGFGSVHAWCRAHRPWQCRCSLAGP